MTSQERSSAQNTEPIIEHPFMVLHYDRYENLWSEDTIFKTVEEAIEEIRAIVESWSEGVVSPEEFVVVPNDFEKLRAFRPLEAFDSIYTGKPNGNIDDHIIARGYTILKGADS